jgi:uncharacterized membrane protein YeaQ/YmgE (transglycosylase-associated protein family)
MRHVSRKQWHTQHLFFSEHRDHMLSCFLPFMWNVLPELVLFALPLQLFYLQSFLHRENDTNVSFREKDETMTVVTVVLAATLEPGGLLMWLIVGLVAGFLASRVMRGGGYGLIGDILVGVLGALLGGWVSSLLGMGGSYGLIGSIVIAFIGACLLLALLHAVSGGTRGRHV